MMMSSDRIDDDEVVSTAVSLNDVSAVYHPTTKKQQQQQQQLTQKTIGRNEVEEEEEEDKDNDSGTNNNNNDHNNSIINYTSFVSVDCASLDDSDCTYYSTSSYTRNNNNNGSCTIRNMNSCCCNNNCSISSCCCCLDQQSNHTHPSHHTHRHIDNHSNCWCLTHPIVVGYAFGPKKMSTMGVVMAEASRVKVIHEEPEEDDDDDGNDGNDDDHDNDIDDDDDDDDDENTSNNGGDRDDGDEHDFADDDDDDDDHEVETLAVDGDQEDDRHYGDPDGSDATTITTTITKPAGIVTTKPEQVVSPHRRQRHNCQIHVHAPSVLTSAALRGLEQLTIDGESHCDPESTIISLGNTDETDIQQIVRYFRSSCSSAASASIASMMSETTVSTPTTTTSSNCTTTGTTPSWLSGTATTTTTTATTTIPGVMGGTHHQRTHPHCRNSRLGRGRNRQQQQQQQQQQRSRRRHPVRISFVPLDPDQPLEDQHGGNFDLILHKLTEDILSCSLLMLSSSSSSNTNNHDKGGDIGCNNNNVVSKEVGVMTTPPDNHQHQQQQQQHQLVSNDPSWKRVRSLQDYQRRNRSCCLVDDPSHVQTVMSRSDIANVLQRCLRGVTTKSGIPVKSPRFVVTPETTPPTTNGGRDSTTSSTSLSCSQELERRLREQGIWTPLIVKPSIAAGTKQSHCMLIALNETALPKLPPKSIVQEYVNHNATLYKVYVLGDFISVYERHSLPNLPPDISDRATVDLMEFDSQRPYPRLADFGLTTVEAADQVDLAGSAASPPSPTCPITAASAAAAADTTATVNVTVDEVRPLVDVLKQAFGLELFGFDILLGSTDGEWLVVDVNYFPSYKEVSNFPSLLARYLTQRVLEQRRREHYP